MKAMITGGAGAAAFYLAEHLRAEHPSVKVRPVTRGECDLTNFADVVEQMAIVRPDVIYHLAADADVRASFDSAGDVLENNILGTVNLFEACRKVGIKPFVQVCSTSEVYGQPSHYPIGEEWPIAPVNPYAVSKTAQDMLGQMYSRCYNFQVVVTRAFGYVNPRRRDLSLSHFARQIAEIEAGRREVLEHGNLSSVRTFCDVRDIARAYAMAVGLKGVFNIGAEAPVAIGECLDILIEMANCQIKRRINMALARPSDVTNIIPLCNKFRLATGWEPQYALRASLSWLLDHYRAEVGAVTEA